MFLACDANVRIKWLQKESPHPCSRRRRPASISVFRGDGVAALESNAPEEELIEVVLKTMS